MADESPRNWLDEVMAAAERGGLSDLPDAPGQEAATAAPDPVLLTWVRDLDHRSGLHCAIHALMLHRTLIVALTTLAAPAAMRGYVADLLAAIHAAGDDSFGAWSGSGEATLPAALAQAQADHVAVLAHIKEAHS